MMRYDMNNIITANFLTSTVFNNNYNYNNNRITRRRRTSAIAIEISCFVYIYVIHPQQPHYNFTHLLTHTSLFIIIYTISLHAF